jgi:hypothetical protein
MIIIGIANSYTIFSRPAGVGTTVVEQDLRGNENYILQIQIWPLGWDVIDANITARFYLDDTLIDTLNCTYLDTSIVYQSFHLGINLTNEAHLRFVITNVLGNEVTISLYRSDHYHYSSYIPRFVDTVHLILIFAIIIIAVLTAILILRMRFPILDETIKFLDPDEPNTPSQQFGFAVNVVYWGLVVGLPLATLASFLYGTPSFTLCSFIGLGIFITCGILLFNSCMKSIRKKIRFGNINLGNQVITAFLLITSIISTGLQMLSSLAGWRAGDWIFPFVDYMILVVGHYFTIILLILLANVCLAVGIVYGRKSRTKKKTPPSQE